VRPSDHSTGRREHNLAPRTPTRHDDRHRRISFSARSPSTAATSYDRAVWAGCSPSLSGRRFFLTRRPGHILRASAQFQRRKDGRGCVTKVGSRLLREVPLDGLELLVDREHPRGGITTRLGYIDTHTASRGRAAEIRRLAADHRRLRSSNSQACPLPSSKRQPGQALFADTGGQTGPTSVIRSPSPAWIARSADRDSLSSDSA
jgi:hypothetical protein